METICHGVCLYIMKLIFVSRNNEIALIWPPLYYFVQYMTLDDLHRSIWLFCTEFYELMSGTMSFYDLLDIRTVMIITTNYYL